MQQRTKAQEGAAKLGAGWVAAGHLHHGPTSLVSTRAERASGRHSRQSASATLGLVQGRQRFLRVSRIARCHHKAIGVHPTGKHLVRHRLHRHGTRGPHHVGQHRTSNAAASHPQHRHAAERLAIGGGAHDGHLQGFRHLGTQTLNELAHGDVWRCHDSKVVQTHFIWYAKPKRNQRPGCSTLPMSKYVKSMALSTRR